MLGSRGADAARHRSNAALLMYGEIPGEALHDPQPVSTLGGLSGSLSVLTGCHVDGDDFESHVVLGSLSTNGDGACAVVHHAVGHKLGRDEKDVAGDDLGNALGGKPMAQHRSSMRQLFWTGLEPPLPPDHHWGITPPHRTLCPDARFWVGRLEGSLESSSRASGCAGGRPRDCRPESSPGALRGKQSPGGRLTVRIGTPWEYYSPSLWEGLPMPGRRQS